MSAFKPSEDQIREATKEFLNKAIVEENCLTSLIDLISGQFFKEAMANVNAIAMGESKIALCDYLLDLAIESQWMREEAIEKVEDWQLQAIIASHENDQYERYITEQLCSG